MSSSVVIAVDEARTAYYVEKQIKCEWHAFVRMPAIKRKRTPIPNIKRRCWHVRHRAPNTHSVWMQCVYTMRISSLSCFMFGGKYIAKMEMCGCIRTNVVACVLSHGIRIWWPLATCALACHGVSTGACVDAARVLHVFLLFVLRWCTLCVYIKQKISNVYILERGDGLTFMCRMSWHRVSVSLLPLSEVQRLLLHVIIIFTVFSCS